MDYKCNVINCEYNNEGKCNYCGDYYNLNDEDCMSFIDKNELAYFEEIVKLIQNDVKEAFKTGGIKYENKII